MLRNNTGIPYHKITVAMIEEFLDVPAQGENKE